MLRVAYLYIGVTSAAGCGGGPSVLSPGRHDLLFRDTVEVADASLGEEVAEPRPDPGGETAEDVEAAAFDEGGEDRSSGETGAVDVPPVDPGAEDPDSLPDTREEAGLDDPGPYDPGTGDPGTGDPGAEDPGTGDPGPEDPGTDEPGTLDPGTADPGFVDEGAADPGATDPAPTDPGTGEAYTGIYAGLEDVTGTELARRLCLLVTTGYKTVSYSTAGDLVRDNVDNFGGEVEEIYSGYWQDPDGLNMEHTWPQSKGATGPAKSDMFHLYASNPDYNSPRGNMPYGNVVNKNWPSTSSEVCNHACTDHFPGRQDVGCCSIRGTDGSGSLVFEPRDAHKGNVARAVFYFALKYEGCERPSLSAYDGYSTAHTAVTEAVHKDWNHRDPPDADEQARNDRIQKYQKVRNPFIDHPEFVDRIDFTP